MSASTERSGWRRGRDVAALGGPGRRREEKLGKVGRRTRFERASPVGRYLTIEESSGRAKTGPERSPSQVAGLRTTWRGFGFPSFPPNDHHRLAGGSVCNGWPQRT